MPLGLKNAGAAYQGAISGKTILAVKAQATTLKPQKTLNFIFSRHKPPPLFLAPKTSFLHHPPSSPHISPFTNPAPQIASIIALSLFPSLTLPLSSPASPPDKPETSLAW